MKNITNILDHVVERVSETIARLKNKYIYRYLSKNEQALIIQKFIKFNELMTHKIKILNLYCM